MGVKSKTRGSKSSTEDSPIEEEEKERMPFDTVPNANIWTDQSNRATGDLAINGTKGIEPEEIRPNTLVPTKSRVSTRSQRSYAGADGYTRFSEDNEISTPAERKQETDTGQDGEIIVDWDGENDPMSPRSMSIARKWLIVIILSASSLCVYVQLLTVCEKEKIPWSGTDFALHFTYHTILSPFQRCCKHFVYFCTYWHKLGYFIHVQLYL